MRIGFFKYVLLFILILSTGFAFSQVTITVTNVDDPDCGDPTGGRIDVDVSGGITPYTLNLFESPATFIATKSGNGPSFFFDGLGEGTYFIVVTDNTGLDNDVTPSQILTITQPTISVLTPLPIDICENAGNQNLAALVSADIGGGTFTFSGPGVSGSTFNPSGLGGTIVNIDVDYTIPPSCNAPTVQIVYNVNDAPNPALPVSDAVVCNPATGDAIFTITSAESGVNYELTIGGTPLVPPVTGTGTGANLDLTLLQADLPTSTTTYTVVASIAGCPDTNLTDQPILTVNPEPDASLGVSDAVICNPATGDVPITITNAENGVLYELTNGGVPLVPPVTGTGTGTDLNLTILQADAPITTTIYTVVATIPGCSNTNLTDQPTITVNDAPDIGLSVSDASICNPAESNVIITITGAENGVSYELTNGGVPLVPPVTGTGVGADLALTILQANAPTSTITYTVVASIAGCASTNLTDQPTVTVNDQPDNTLAVSDATICSPPSGDVIITITSAESGVDYELTVGGTPLVPPVTGTGAGANLDLTILQANAPIATTTYTVVASRTGCSTVSLLDQPVVTVNNAPDPGLSVSDASACNPAEGDVVVTIAGSEIGVSYELTNGGVPLVPPVTGVGTGANLDLTILQANAPVVTTIFTIEATVSGCPSVNLLDQPTVTVNNSPNDALSVSDASICNPASGDVIITITSAESGILYELTNGGAPLVPPVTGTGTGADLDLTILQANAPTSTITYTVVATQAGCSDVNLLDQPTVSVNNAPDNSLSVSDPIICNPAGGDVIITVNGAEAGVTYELTNGGVPLVPPVSAVGAGGNLDLTILQANAPIADIIYGVEASIGGCPSITLVDQANVEVNDEPNDGLSVSDVSICNPATGDVVITITTAELGVTYELTDGGASLVPPVTGIGTGADLDLTILQANAPTTSISYIVEASIPGCSIVNLIDPADVTVTNAPNNGLNVSDPVICNPASGDVIVTVGLAEVGVTYELTSGGAPLAPPVTGVGTGADLDLTILQANAPTSTTNLTVVATISGCIVNLVDQAAVSVNNAPNPGLLVSDATTCNPAEGDITLTITSAEPGIDYELTIGGVPLAVPVVGTGSGGDLDLVILQANAPVTTTTYTVVASIVGCSDVNLLDQPVVTVSDSPNPGLAVSDNTSCIPAPGDVTFTITNAEAGVNYELTIGGTSLTPVVSGVGAGADLDLTILQADVPTTTTTYTIVASVGGCSNVNLTDQPILSILTPDVNLVVSDPGVCNPATGDVIITVFGAEAGVTYEVTDGGTPLVPAVTGVGAGGDLDLTILQANAPTTNISYTIQATNVGCPTVDLIDQSDIVINTSAPVDPPIITGPTLGCDNETVVDFMASAVTNGVTYQWELDEGFGYVNQGETSNTLTLDFSLLGTGSFLVRALAENGCGIGPFSADFSFDIVTAPTIDTQPLDQIVCQGTDAIFSVDVSATNPSYQWQVDTGSGFNDIAGEVNATLTVSNVGPTEDGNQYQVIVRESGSCPLVSSIAILSVNQNTTINTQPEDQTVNVGDDATFTVDASGVNLTYQWQVSADGGASFSDLSGETTSTLVIGNAQLSQDGNLFQVIVLGDCGTNPTPNPATLTVIDNTPPDCSGFIVQVQDIQDTSCGTTDGGFTLNTNGSGILPYTVEVFLDDGSSNPILTQSDTVVTGLAPNNYRYLITGTDGCFFGDDQIVVVEKQLVASVTSANANCAGEEGTIIIDVTTGAGNYEYSLDQTNWTSFISGENIPLSVGTYDNIFVRDSSGEFCPTSDGPVTITEPNAFNVTVEQTLESVPERASGSILLRPVSGGQPYNDIGYWASIVLQTPTAPDQYQPQTLVRDSVAGQFNQEQGVFQVNFEDLFAGIYEVTVFDSSEFCFTVLNVEVPLDTDLFIPNVFTPNQDGFNDFFFIRNMPEDQPTEVTIVNRWGRRVYSSTNYQNDWQAEDLSDGIYYYTITVGGEMVQGWVEVWRGAR